MRIVVEKSLRDFDFWSGGADRAEKCSDEELDSIEEFLEEIAPEDGWSDTGINDMFWFDFDTLAQHLGYENEEDFDLKHDPNYIDDDELKSEIDEWFQEFLNEKAQQVNQETIDLIVSIAMYVFDYESELDNEEEYTHDDCLRCLDYLRSQHDEDTLYDFLFEDNRGECETDGEIPSWKDFREMIMQKRQENAEA